MVPFIDQKGKIVTSSQDIVQHLDQHLNSRIDAVIGGAKDQQRASSNLFRQLIYYVGFWIVWGYTQNINLPEEETAGQIAVAIALLRRLAANNFGAVVNGVWQPMKMPEKIINDSFVEQVSLSDREELFKRLRRKEETKLENWENDRAKKMRFIKLTGEFRNFWRMLYAYLYHLVRARVEMTVAEKNEVHRAISFIEDLFTALYMQDVSTTRME